jgi:hypothetical protein
MLSFSKFLGAGIYAIALTFASSGWPGVPMSTLR